MFQIKATQAVLILLFPNPSQFNFTVLTFFKRGTFSHISSSSPISGKNDLHPAEQHSKFQWKDLMNHNI